MSAPCPARIFGIGPLACTRLDAHTTHVYESTSVMDGRHDDEADEG